MHTRSDAPEVGDPVSRICRTGGADGAVTAYRSARRGARGMRSTRGVRTVMGWGRASPLSAAGADVARTDAMPTSLPRCRSYG